MLRISFGTVGPPPAPADIWTAWNLDPFLLVPLLAVGGIYWRGWILLHHRRLRGWRPWWFTAGWLALGIALVSPLDSLSGALASAHMSQHMLLVFGPALMAASRPMNSLLRGVRTLTEAVGPGWPRKVGPDATLRVLQLPVVAWLLHTTTLWVWHARIPYEAALRIDALHALEHATFWLTALLFWSVVVKTTRSHEMGWGLGLLLVFSMTVQTTILAALMTFARTPWYSAYAETTQVWGLDHLADQQLAAVIMWIPSGMIYFVAAILLMTNWIKEASREKTAGNAPTAPR